MYPIKLNRDDVLIEEVLIEQILSALPASFKYRASIVGLKRGRLIAENGHCAIHLKTIQNDLWLFVAPKSLSGLSRHHSAMIYQKLKSALSDLVLERTALSA